MKEKLYKMCLLIRRFEEKLCELYPSDKIKSPVHLSIGQEAVSTGVALAMSHNDIISNTYRSHGTYIAKGGNLNEMMIELYGKKGGCGDGKAGSMHLFDKQAGVLPTSAVVGTTVPMAAGFALSVKMRKSQQVVVTMFGDGSTEEGCFSETINFAKLHNLPMLFVCENNKLAIHNPIERRWANLNICKRVESYGIPTVTIDSGDVEEIYLKTKDCIEKVRSGLGPIFMEIFTYRYKEHVGPSQDIDEQYRNQSEYKLWIEKDPIVTLEKTLDQTTIDRIKSEVESEIQEAVNAAEKAEFPNTYSELYQNVYSI
jgi:TPP-dependent pyruvate/acetoin dehydrogenase alpha subunit